MLAIGYGLNSLTTPSKTVKLSPEKMNKVQELAKSSAKKDFKSQNFEAWKSGLKDLLINWFFDEESNETEVDLSVVITPKISLGLICSETWLDNIYVNFKSQEMSLRDYIEQAVKNTKHRYSPDLLVYLLGVYRDTYVNNYKSVSNDYNVQKALNFVKDKLVFWCGRYIYWDEQDSVTGLNHAISDLLSEETEAKIVLVLPKGFCCSRVDSTLKQFLQESQLTINGTKTCSYSEGINQLRGSYGLRLTDEEMFCIYKGAVGTLIDITTGRPTKDPTADLNDPNLTPEQQKNTMLDRIRYLSIEGNKVAKKNKELSRQLSSEKYQVQAKSEEIQKLNQQLSDQETRNSAAIEELEHKHSEEIDKMKLEYSEKVEQEKAKQENLKSTITDLETRFTSLEEKDYWMATPELKCLIPTLSLAYQLGRKAPSESDSQYIVQSLAEILEKMINECLTDQQKCRIFYKSSNINLAVGVLTSNSLNETFSIKHDSLPGEMDLLPGVHDLYYTHGLQGLHDYSVLFLINKCWKAFLLGVKDVENLKRQEEDLNKYETRLNKFKEILDEKEKWLEKRQNDAHHPESQEVRKRRKKEHKTTETFERFMRKVAEKNRQKFAENTYVKISELIDCLDDPETKKLFSDKRNDFMNKRKIKRNTKISDYNDIYSGELPENNNYFDIAGSGNTNQNYKHELEELSSDNEDYSVSDDEDTQNSESNEDVATYDNDEYDENSQYCVKNSDSDDDDSTNNSDWFDSPEEEDYSETDESEHEPQENNQNSVTEEYNNDIQDETSFNMLNDSGEDLNEEEQINQELDEN